MKNASILRSTLAIIVHGDGGVVLAIDSLLCSSIAAVFVVVVAGLDDGETVIG
jgi:hypothetical protein